jgi:hypothetical protein
MHAEGGAVRWSGGLDAQKNAFLSAKIHKMLSEAQATEASSYSLNCYQRPQSIMTTSSSLYDLLSEMRLDCATPTMATDEGFVTPPTRVDSPQPETAAIPVPK